MPDPNPVTDAERIAMMDALFPKHAPHTETLGIGHNDIYYAEAATVLNHACRLQRRVDELERLLLPEPVLHVAPPMPEDSQ